MRYLAEMLAAALLSAGSQPQLHAASLPALPDLLVALPADISSGRFDFARFSDAVTAACGANPGSFASSIPMIEHDLKDSNSQVRFYTMGVLIGLTMQTGDKRPVLALQKKIESLTLSDDEDNRFVALSLLTAPTIAISDDYARKLEMTMQEKGLPSRLLLASGALLMTTRPDDPIAQEAVITAVTDTDRAIETRCQLLNAAASEVVGTILTRYVITTVNSSPDRYARDCAIGGAERIGPPAVDSVSNTLWKIAGDPTESPESKSLALSALRRTQSTKR